MPHPNTHLLALEDAVKLAGIDLGNFQNFASLGAFGPDLFYLLGRFPEFASKYPSKYGWDVSNILHWEQPLNFFCSMLNHIKEQDDPEVKQKLKAFAYGYYSHVVTDAVMHPLIYMSTGDHWEKHPRLSYDKHKRLEAMIDAYLMKTKRGSNPFRYGIQEKIVCHADDSDRTLDKEVYEMFLKSMNGVYRNVIPDFEKYFSRPEDPRNPILDAYRDTISAFRAAYGLFSSKLPKGLFALEPVKDLNPDEEKRIRTLALHDKSGNPIFPYSVDKLFGMSVSAMAEVIKASQEFLNSDSNDARTFFKGSQRYRKTPYLDHNYNLDTGIRVDFNPNLRRRGNNTAEIFRFSIPILQGCYDRINGKK